MTPTAWDAPVHPQCPESCCWRLTCSTPTQEGIACLWRSGRITKPEQCVFFEHRARLHFETTGQQPPASAAALLEQLAERKAIQAEAGPA